MLDRKVVKRRKPLAERKVRPIMVRVTEEQKRAFAATAKRAGLDLSAWFRWLATKEIAAALTRAGAGS